MKQILIYLMILSLSSGFKVKYSTVSWYGPGFNGKLTANGEKYNQEDYTAASPTLPFNTYVKVTNLKNNKFIVVRINDRGPYKCIKGTSKAVRPLEPHPDRILDLSKASFREIADLNKGVINVKIEIL